MKRYLIISALALAACGNNKQQPAADPKGQLPVSLVSNPHTANGMDNVAADQMPTLVFSGDTVHNFGLMHEGEMVEYEFPFTNTGKTPLLITSAAGSCGCTVPSYPHDPIAPGKGGIIKVSFNSSGKIGHQEKSVAIHANTVKNIHMLYIQAEVAKK